MLEMLWESQHCHIVPHPATVLAPSAERVVFISDSVSWGFLVALINPSVFSLRMSEKLPPLFPDYYQWSFMLSIWIRQLSVSMAKAWGKECIRRQGFGSSFRGFSPWVCGQGSTVHRDGRHRGGGAHLMAAGKQRERRPASRSPFKATTQWPNFLLLGLAS
jgi:hypothetical protein